MRVWFCLSIGVVAACGGSNGGGDCPVGEPGCPCAAGTCPAELVCRDDVCVFDGTGDASGGDASNDTSDAGDVSSGPTGDDASDEGTGDPGGPEVFELFVDPPTLRENDVITLTAHVTDPDGLEDIVGGVLVSSSSGALIDSFVQIRRVVRGGALVGCHRRRRTDMVRVGRGRVPSAPSSSTKPSSRVPAPSTFRSTAAARLRRVRRRHVSPARHELRLRGMQRRVHVVRERDLRRAGVVGVFRPRHCRAQVMASPLVTGPETCEIPLDSYPAARCCCGPV